MDEVSHEVDPTDIDGLNELLKDDVWLEPYEPGTIDDWFSDCRCPI